MATKTWKIEKDLCRCCHAEGAFDNLAEPRIFLEKEEVYSDMLRECLDIDIPPVPGELCSITYTICNACIIRLRDACNFKKQVQDCEQRFMTLYYKNAIQGLKPATKVKEELEVEGPASDTEADIIVLKKEDEDDDDDNFLGGGDDDAMSDDDLPIKPAKQSVSTMKTRPKPKPKPAPKAKAPVVKKLKPPPKPKKKEEPKPAKEKKGSKHQVLNGWDYRMAGDKFVCTHCDASFEILNALYGHLLTQHMSAQAGKVRKYLNVKYKKDYKIDGDRFVCIHCDKSYERIRGLTDHVRTKHFNIPRSEQGVKSARVKLGKDYTMEGERFLCTHCDETYDEIKQLYSHIRKEHYNIQKLQLKSGKDYKMDGEKFVCTHCNKPCDNIRLLYEHIITEHYNIPKSHIGVRLGEDYSKDGDRFSCIHCNKDCNTVYMMYHHIRTEHLIVPPTHTCQICYMGFSTESGFVIHKLKEHNIDDRYDCNACTKKFNSRRTLREHVQYYHMQGTARKCPICDYVTYEPAMIKRHMLKHKKEKNHKCAIQHVRRGRDYMMDDDKFVCNHCDESFEILPEVYRHLNSRHVIGMTRRLNQKIKYKRDYKIHDDRFVCIRCDKTCTKISALYEHIRTEHFNIRKSEQVESAGVRQLELASVTRDQDYSMEGERYICTHCDETYDNIGLLHTHILTEHYNVQKVQVESGKDYKMDGEKLNCTHCNKSYDNIKPLYIHIITEHYNVSKRNIGVRLGRDYTKDGDRFSCHYCDHICQTPESMRTHLRAKHLIIEPPNHTCVICSMEFKSESQYTIHQLKEHNLDRRHECKACNAKFNTRLSFKSHIDGFHMQGEKQKCPSCDYEAYKVGNMKNHMLKHKKEKDYKCKFCEKSFVRLTTMRLHERIHTGDKRYKCQVCDKAFVQKASLNYHMTKYHPEVNY